MFQNSSLGINFVFKLTSSSSLNSGQWAATMQFKTCFKLYFIFFEFKGPEQGNAKPFC